MKIVFLRHGESLGNTSGKFYTDDRTNFLSLQGVLQAQLAAHSIKKLPLPNGLFDASFVSDMTRSGQTACIVLQTLMDTRDHLIRDPRINEWCFKAVGGKNWHLTEPTEEFWARIEEFYDEVIAPVMDTDVTYLITSHYYTMKGLFDVMGVRTGLINSYAPLNPHNNNDIPNAVPFYYDSKIHDEPQMITASYRNKSR